MDTGAEHRIIISILGCGWLGTALAVRLLTCGYIVNGSARTKEGVEALSMHNVEPFLLFIGENGIKGEGVEKFLSADVLVISVPPPRDADSMDVYPRQIGHVVKLFQEHSSGKVILWSSTSVYGSPGCEVTEEDSCLPDKPSGMALLEAERLLTGFLSKRLIVLRLAGLIGYERTASSILKKGGGKKDMWAPLNLVHRDDAVEVTLRAIQGSLPGGIFNVCADKHPLRKDFYRIDASGPDNVEMRYKLVSNNKIKDVLGYTFWNPDPLLI